MTASHIVLCDEWVIGNLISAAFFISISKDAWTLVKLSSDHQIDPGIPHFALQGGGGEEGDNNILMILP